MKHADLLKQLLPPVSYDINGHTLARLLMAEGHALDQSQEDAVKVSKGLMPFDAGVLLDDWERVCGLTSSKSDTYAQRTDAVISKLNERGGLSIDYFLNLSRRLGYDLTIHEFEPFYVDYSSLDEFPLYDQMEIIYIWQLNVKHASVNQFHFYLDFCGIDESLHYFVNHPIEELFNNLKPAHTMVVFNYEDATNATA